MDAELRRKWETILNQHPDPAAKERAREVLSAAGPSEETEEIAQGVSDVSKRAPVSLLDAMTMRREEPDQRSTGRKVLDTINPLSAQNQASFRAMDRATEKIIPGITAFTNSAFDRFSMGLLPKLRDALGTSSPEERARVEAESPTASQLGAGTGLGASMLAGPGKAASMAAEQGLARVAPSLVGSLQARVGLPAVVGGAMGAAENPDDAVESGAAGAGLGTLGGAAGIAAGGARAAIQKASPWVKRYAQAKDEGLLPGAKELPRGRAGVVEASEKARDKILARQGQIAESEGAAYEAAEAASKGKPGDVAAVRAELDKIRRANQLSTGRPIDSALDNEISSMESMLLEDSPVDDLLALRRNLQERANFSNKNPGDTERAARKLYDALRTGVRSSSPELAAADDAFSEGAKTRTRTNEILGSPKGVKTAKQKRQAAAELEYYGDDSVPALQRKQGLDELAGQDPEYLQAMKELGAKKALEATRLFTLSPGTRTSLSPAVQAMPGGMTLQSLMQFGRGGARMLDQSLQVPQQQPLLPLSLLDLALKRRNQE